MATIVDVEDDSLALFEVALDAASSCSKANVAKTEGGYGAPNEKIAGSIAAIVFKESVQSFGSG